MEDFNFVLPSHGNPIVLDWIRDGKAVFQPGPLETPCLVWQLSKIDGGYGFVFYNSKRELAHRIAIGAVKDLCALHACDRPECVNPDHLRIGTKSENSNDMKARNRSLRVGVCPRCECGRARQTGSKEYCEECRAMREGKPLCQCGSYSITCGLCSACYQRSVAHRYKEKKNAYYRAKHAERREINSQIRKKLLILKQNELALNPKLAMAKERKRAYDRARLAEIRSKKQGRGQ